MAFDNCNYDVHVIANHEASNIRNGAGDTDVVLTVTGESPCPLILVLTSYETVRWRLSISSGVTIDRVILVSYWQVVGNMLDMYKCNTWVAPACKHYSTISI